MSYFKNTAYKAVKGEFCQNSAEINFQCILGNTCLINKESSIAAISLLFRLNDFIYPSIVSSSDKGGAA